jgi:predicted nuclease of predicted toxin-antitoxin system
VRLWIDECLSPTLVKAAQRRYEATCNAYRGLLAQDDARLYALVSREGWVLVTNDGDDFRRLAVGSELHAGLVLLPQRLRAEQPPMLEAVLDYIEQSSTDARLSVGDWMINRVVEYDDNNSIHDGEWPSCRTRR